MRRVRGNTWLLVVTLSALWGAAQADVLTVGPPPARFQTIQSAIAAAKPGDTIQVQPGVYSGQFILDKQLTLEGVGKPVLRGEGRGSVVILAADRCSIRDFVIEHSGGDLQAEDSGLLLKSNENTV
ncbi:MAG: right-handed parallel beta-helix repeat-containing protein, partial [Blastocatellia bacterium]